MSSIGLVIIVALIWCAVFIGTPFIVYGIINYRMKMRTLRRIDAMLRMVGKKIE